ncbi:acyl-CoA N-acyltransferase [Dothidotthia symphoricarpi CBS 119687]|uniref:Acyl-CoA N-acyltransferase n=1 Tax=Dothidotthia symphoricarpi CBS 119687 TaxID=1392245 RepID=A0A6A6AIX2_9PLEO|nr:acyl-CoA N-acyltransferase [Dothidotthia symphoricarpi CBS 119687]KAF2130381.1 acyl-CoA N-acyltransferase [Dothidotthia symphoricarpi CBS 119687]
MSSPSAPPFPHPHPHPTWTIQPVTHSTTNEVVTFINKARRTLFPNLQLNNAPLPNDVARTLKRGVFLTARPTSQHDKNALIAVVGYVPYDYSFPQLALHGPGIVEVVRLFVVPEYRRCGLASALFGALEEVARQSGVQCLYLHTHPFLPGAVRFWEKMGFEVRDVEDDPVWRTTHMLMGIESGVSLREEKEED